MIIICISVCIVTFIVCATIIIRTRLTYEKGDDIIKLDCIRSIITTEIERYLSEKAEADKKEQAFYYNNERFKDLIYQIKNILE